MYLRIIAVAVLLFLSASAAAESDALVLQTEFILQIDPKGPGSESLLQGDIPAAISAAERSAKHGQKLSAFMTLCAAHIYRGALQHAELACNQAIEASKKPITTKHNPYGRANREGRSMAYSNRGVLRSLQGNLDGAAADFRTALRQKRNVRDVHHNMRLSGSGTRLASGG